MKMLVVKNDFFTSLLYIFQQTLIGLHVYYQFFTIVLRAVCCKDQLRSCNIEKKNDFPKLCQNKGLGELVPKICVSGRLDFYLFFGRFFVFCALSGLNWHRNRALSGQKLPFKKWKCCRKDQPRKSKDIISSVYCRWKISKRVEPEFLTKFLNLCFATEVTNSEFGRNSMLKKALWYMASPSETTLWGRTIISTTRWAKKNWGKSNGGFWQYFQNRSLEQYERPFDLWCQIKSHTTAFNLTFIRWNTRFFTFVCFADLFEGRRD